MGVARKEALTMFGRRKAIVKPAECPVCQCAEGVNVLRVTVVAGEEEQVVGRARDCVRCGERYTALFSGVVIRQRSNVPAPMAELVKRAAGAPENALSALPLDVNDLDGML